MVCAAGLNLLQNEAQQTLLAIDHACLAIIAVTAGAELHFDNIRRIHKQVNFPADKTTSVIIVDQFPVCCAISSDKCTMNL